MDYASPTLPDAGPILPTIPTLAATNWPAEIPIYGAVKSCSTGEETARVGTSLLYAALT